MVSRAVHQATRVKVSLMPTGNPARQSVRRVQRSKISAGAHGFAYVLLLIAVSVIGIVASASLSLSSQIARRDAEQHLLAIGTEFEHAIRAYAAVPANATGAVNARGPRALEDLLKDPRSVSPRRHLRQIYADPLTGKDAWGLVKDPAGFVVGVYSLADGKPIKQTGFAVQQVGFEDAETYAAWVFGLPNTQLPANVRSR
jgi:type II secretory pathway pseudopilin PulG